MRPSNLGARGCHASDERPLRDTTSAGFARDHFFIEGGEGGLIGNHSKVGNAS